jgi:hypothetical protein
MAERTGQELPTQRRPERLAVMSAEAIPVGPVALPGKPWVETSRGLVRGGSQARTTARTRRICYMATTMTPQVQFRTVDGVRIRYAESGGSQ